MNKTVERLVDIATTKHRIWHALAEEGGEMHFSELYKQLHGVCRYVCAALAEMKKGGEVMYDGEDRDFLITLL